VAKGEDDSSRYASPARGKPMPFRYIPPEMTLVSIGELQRLIIEKEQSEQRLKDTENRLNSMERRRVWSIFKDVALIGFSISVVELARAPFDQMSSVLLSLTVVLGIGLAVALVKTYA